MEALAKRTPDRREYMGFLGAIAARRGDSAGARNWSESLRQLSRPYLFGSHSLRRARIAALLGEKAMAVDSLRDALAQGAFFGIEMHRDVDLEPLKDNPEFRDVMRPKD